MRELSWGPGSISVIDVLLRPGGPAISAEARVIYAALYSHMGPDARCWPSIATLASGTGLSERTVRRRTAELVAAGLCDRIETPGKVTVYRLHPPWAPVQRDTPVSVAGVPRSERPRSDSHPGQADRTPRSESPDTPVSVTAEVTHLSNPLNTSAAEAEECAPAGDAQQLWTTAVEGIRQVSTPGMRELLSKCRAYSVDQQFLCVDWSLVPEGDRERIMLQRFVLERALIDATGLRRGFRFGVPLQNEARAGPQGDGDTS